MKKKAVPAALVLCMLLFAAIAASVMTGAADAFNSSVIEVVRSNQNDGLTFFMKLISNMGAWFVYVPVALLFLIIPRARLKIGVTAAVTLAFAFLLNNILKILFGVERPDNGSLVTEHGYGFPSGHAMVGTAFVGLCCYLFLRYSYKTALKIFVFSASCTFIALLAISRIYLGVHSPTDVIGGFLAGMFICILACALYEIKARDWTTYSG